MAALRAEEREKILRGRGLVRAVGPVPGLDWEFGPQIR
jgi:hypothetical protein